MGFFSLYLQLWISVDSIPYASVATAQNSEIGYIQHHCRGRFWGTGRYLVFRPLSWCGNYCDRRFDSWRNLVFYDWSNGARRLWWRWRRHICSPRQRDYHRCRWRWWGYIVLPFFDMELLRRLSKFHNRQSIKRREFRRDKRFRWEWGSKLGRRGRWPLEQWSKWCFIYGWGWHGSFIGRDWGC